MWVLEGPRGITEERVGLPAHIKCYPTVGHVSTTSLDTSRISKLIKIKLYFSNMVKSCSKDK